MTITIDSTVYNIPLKVVNRKADVLYKYAERLENGDLASEVLGVYYNFDCEAGMSKNNVADYAALFLKLSEPVASHTITMPGAPSGYTTFSCYFAGVKDQVSHYQLNGVDYFRNLTFSVIAISPARTPA